MNLTLVNAILSTSYCTLSSDYQIGERLTEMNADEWALPGVCWIFGRHENTESG
jgi:hypothetical protein